jgi:hypothetical protein
MLSIMCFTKSNGIDVALAELAGQDVRAESRSGAELAICREVVLLGLPDDEWQTIFGEGRVGLTGKSIHRAALLMVADEPTCKFVEFKTIERGEDGKMLARTCEACGERGGFFRGVCMVCATLPAFGGKTPRQRKLEAKARKMGVDDL